MNNKNIDEQGNEQVLHVLNNALNKGYLFALCVQDKLGNRIMVTTGNSDQSVQKLLKDFIKTDKELR